MRLQKVVGQIEVLGQSIVKPETVSYSYIRFVGVDGKVTTVNDVMTENQCGSYISPGAEGTFYLSSLRDYKLIYALRVRGRFIDQTTLAVAARDKLLGRAMLHLLIGIPMTFLIIGIPALGEGVLALIAYRMAPTLAELQAFILDEDPADSQKRLPV